tara:strand:+ start:371 stop:1642 length:1272 start_codon:yes stop_codon:yes gene_type:complete
MPVSPADFEFYSRMTGQPIPNTPAGRMAIAPQVYNMRRGGGGFGRVLRGAAKGALAAGALAGAGALALATQEELAKGKAPTKEKSSSDVDLGAASSTRPEMSISTGPVQSDVQRFQTGSGEELIGRAATPAEIQAFRNRISGQTVVPQADPSIANESRGAQLASTSEPTQPRVEVRQQPSSGVTVTSLSNQAAVEGGMPAKETNPELSAIRQQLEMYEGSPTQSPFQAGGAMEELRRQSMDVKRSVGDLPRSIRGDVGVFLSNLSGQTAAPAPTAARSAAKEIQQQLGRMSERDQVQYQGGLKGSAPQGVYGSLETSQDVMGDAPLGGLSSSKETMRGIMERGNVLPDAIEQMSRGDKSYVPTPETAGPFVSNKGREIGALLQKAQSPKVDAKRMQAEERARKTLGLGHPAFETLVQKFMGGM